MLCVIKFTWFWWSHWQWPAGSPLCWCLSGCKQSGMMDFFCEVVRDRMQDMTERERKVSDILNRNHDRELGKTQNVTIWSLSRVELSTPHRKLNCNDRKKNSAQHQHKFGGKTLFIVSLTWLIRPIYLFIIYLNWIP